MVAILLLAFVLRIGTAAAFQGLDAPPDAGAQPDQLDYEKLAYHLSVGEGYCLEPGEPTAFRTPGTSLTLLPAYLVFGRSWTMGRIWFALISSATVLLVGLFGREAFGNLAGLLAAGWLAINPGHFYYSMHFLSETPFGFWLALGAFATLLAAHRRSIPWALVAGLAIGLATLTRPQALFCVPLAWAAAPFLAGGLRKVDWVRLSWGTAGFVLALLPWVVRNQITMGHATMSSVGGCTFWGAHNRTIGTHPELAGAWIPVTDLVDAEHPMEGDEFEIDALCWQYGREWVNENTDAMPALLWTKVVRSVEPFGSVPNPLAYWAFGLSWIFSLPFLIAGMVLAWRADRVAAMTVILICLATLITVLLFYGSRRFRDGIAYAFAAPIGLAAARLVTRWR